MGKKSRKHKVETKSHLCLSLSDKSICKLVDELWERLLESSKRFSNVPPLHVLWEEYDSVIGLLKTILLRQGASPVPLPPRQKGFDAFLRWMRSNGASLEKVKISEFPSVEYGLELMDTVHEEEKVIVVPERLMMTLETASQGPLGKLIASESLLKAMPNLSLALHLLNERSSPDSFWKPYIDALPHRLTLPLFFNKQELLELQASPAVVDSLCQIKNIARLYTILHKQLRTLADPNLPLCTVGFHLSDFMWAVGCVMSRQNKLPRQGFPEKTTMALIPLWDMANHENGRILTDFNVDAKCCECYSMRAASAGQEFRIFYGPRSNFDFFVNQGFVFPENSHDAVRIWLGLSSAEEEHTKKARLALFQRVGMPGSGNFLVKKEPRPFPGELCTFARLFTASTDKLEQWKSFEDAALKKALLSQLQGTEDHKALEFLEKRCTLLLAAYKTSLEEDEAVISSDTSSMSPCMLQAVLLRMCEKRLLQSAALFACKQRALATSQCIAGSGQDDIVGTSTPVAPGNSKQPTNNAEGVNNACTATPNGSNEDAASTRTCIQ